MCQSPGGGAKGRDVSELDEIGSNGPVSVPLLRRSRWCTSPYSGSPRGYHHSTRHNKSPRSHSLDLSIFLAVNFVDPLSYSGP